MDYHQLSLPQSSEFDKQVERLRRSYEECHEFLLFAKLVEALYPHGEAFSEMMKLAQDSKARDVMVHEMQNAGDCDIALACDNYKNLVEKVKFEPFDLNGLEETSPDFSTLQIEEMKRTHREELQQKSIVRKMNM
jgi:hypothetical protein